VTIELLVVEDNAADAELIRHALARVPISVPLHVAADGEEALDFVLGRGAWAGRDAARSLRLVLLDLKLPKVHGLDVLREIKSTESTRTIPIVVLTSSRHESDVEAAYRLGANGYVVKPVEFEEFRVAVRQLGSYWLEVNEPAP
jgi:two-component system response regulator